MKTDTSAFTKTSLPIPSYLDETYWWAYIHPRAVHLFERKWLVNLILLGNYDRLCDAVLETFGKKITGQNLQIACAYGDLTPRIAERLDEQGHLDVIDIVPIQLSNLKGKLTVEDKVDLHQMNSMKLDFDNDQFDRTLMYFLLHEQPMDVRVKTLSEGLRVLRPGGTLTIVDFARPSRWNPVKYIWMPILSVLEPFAPDLWHGEVAQWLPKNVAIADMKVTRYFGGTFQMINIVKG